MQKPLLFGVGGLVIGLIIGFFGANSLNRGVSPGTNTMTVSTVPGQPAAPNVQGAPQGGGMMPDVAEAIEKAKSEPQNLEAQMKVADMYWKINRYDRAAEFYEKAVAINPGDFTLNVRLANAYFENKQFENAEKYYAKALEIKPNDIDARTDLGTTFVERQLPDLDRGLSELEKVIAIDPKHEPALYNIAVIYSKKGDSENVTKMLTRLEEIDATSRYVTRLRQLSAAK